MKDGDSVHTGDAGRGAEVTLGVMLEVLEGVEVLSAGNYNLR